MLFPKLCHGCFPYQRHKSIGTGHWLHSACKEPEYPILPLIGCVFRLGLEQTMNDSLVICREQFAEFWGQRLVNLMRALHEVKYSRHAADDEEDDCGFEEKE